MDEPAVSAGVRPIVGAIALSLILALILALALALVLIHKGTERLSGGRGWETASESGVSGVRMKGVGRLSGGRGWMSGDERGVRMQERRGRARGGERA